MLLIRIHNRLFLINDAWIIVPFTIGWVSIILWLHFKPSDNSEDNIVNKEIETFDNPPPKKPFFKRYFIRQRHQDKVSAVKSYKKSVAIDRVCYGALGNNFALLRLRAGESILENAENTTFRDSLRKVYRFLKYPYERFVQYLYVNTDLYEQEVASQKRFALPDAAPDPEEQILLTKKSLDEKLFNTCHIQGDENKVKFVDDKKLSDLILGQYKNLLNNKKLLYIRPHALCYLAKANRNIVGFNMLSGFVNFSIVDPSTFLIKLGLWTGVGAGFVLTIISLHTILIIRYAALLQYIQIFIGIMLVYFTGDPLMRSAFTPIATSPISEISIEQIEPRRPDMAELIVLPMPRKDKIEMPVTKKDAHHSYICMLPGQIWTPTCQEQEQIVKIVTHVAYDFRKQKILTMEKLEIFDQTDFKDGPKYEVKRPTARMATSPKIDRNSKNAHKKEYFDREYEAQPVSSPQKAEKLPTNFD